MSDRPHEPYSFRVKAASAHVDVPERTIYDHIVSGDLPACVYGNGTQGSGDLLFYGGPSLLAPFALSSFRTDMLTSIIPAVSGTGAIVTLVPTVYGGLGSGQANTYYLF